MGCSGEKCLYSFYDITIYKQSHVLYHMKHTNYFSLESRFMFYHWFDGILGNVAADLNDADSTTCVTARHNALREKVKPRKNDIDYFTATNSMWRNNALSRQIRVNIGSGNGLLGDGSKQLPQPMLTYHQVCSVVFT